MSSCLFYILCLALFYSPAQAFWGSISMCRKLFPILFASLFFLSHRSIFKFWNCCSYCTSVQLNKIFYFCVDGSIRSVSGFISVPENPFCWIFWLCILVHFERAEDEPGARVLGHSLRFWRTIQAFSFILNLYLSRSTKLILVLQMSNGTL